MPSASPKRGCKPASRHSFPARLSIVYAMVFLLTIIVISTIINLQKKSKHYATSILFFGFLECIL